MSEEHQEGHDTGVDGYFEFVDAQTEAVFFAKKNEKHRGRWGLPLSSLLSAKDAKDENNLGWCVHVEMKTYKKFYSNEKTQKVQWRIPEVLQDALEDLDYFETTRSFSAKDTADSGALNTMNRAPSSENVTKPPVSKPLVRRYTLRRMVDVLDLETILRDQIAFQKFQEFAKVFYASDQILLYAMMEAFGQNNNKGMKKLGLDDRVQAPKSSISKLALSASPQTREILRKSMKRSESELQQIQKHAAHAEKYGVSHDKAQQYDEAQIMYKRFLVENAKNWVYVSDKVAESLKLDFENAGKTGEVSPDIFSEVKKQIYQNMKEDLLPRFLKLCFAPFNATHDLTEFGNVGLSQGFEIDSVVRHHLIQLQSAEPLSQSLKTANALSALHPSPRMVFLGREGSGLAPTATSSGGEEEEDKKKRTKKPNRFSTRLLSAVTRTGRKKQEEDDEDDVVAREISDSLSDLNMSTAIHSNNQKLSETNRKSVVEEVLDLDTISFDIPVMN